jgi:hypothetical protein
VTSCIETLYHLQCVHRTTFYNRVNAIKENFMPERLNETELAELAYNAIPATGEISYRTLWQNIKSSAQPDAVKMIAYLKANKRIKARLEQMPDGSIAHMYSRVGGE